MNKTTLSGLMLLQLLMLNSCAVNHSVIKASLRSDRVTHFESSHVNQIDNTGAQKVDPLQT
ncbi:hypothetical protein [Pseudescherichia sp.]|uniref:hypothetical protein n=1 Tax=Pseudescherichia sp. TaxID=2055881 RepID=UPI00289AC9A7|nr:hypothetical protein [Pseudescherichia sp.]